MVYQGSQIQSVKDSPVTPPLERERPHRNIPGSSGFASTPKLSSISGTKTETSSIDGSARSSSVDRSEEVSVSNASDMESEWVEQDEPGIYITIRALPDGNRELRRVRFRYITEEPILLYYILLFLNTETMFVM